MYAIAKCHSNEWFMYVLSVERLLLYVWRNVFEYFIHIFFALIFPLHNAYLNANGESVWMNWYINENGFALDE